MSPIWLIACLSFWGLDFHTTFLLIVKYSLTDYCYSANISPKSINEWVSGSVVFLSQCEHTVLMVTVKTVRSGLWRSGAVTVSLGKFPDRRLRPVNAGAPSGECVCFQWLELRRAHGLHTCTNTQALRSTQKLKGFVYVDLVLIGPTCLRRRLLRHQDTSRSGSNSDAYRIVFKQPKLSWRIWSDFHLVDLTRVSEFCTRRNQKW